MPNNPLLTYWDANLFLDYVSRTPGRVEVIDALIADARSGGTQIATSILSISEAAYSARERQARQADPLVEEALDEMFGDYSLLTLIEYDQRIAVRARTLMRRTLSFAGRLKPADAVHLASAEHVGADVIYSFDAKFQRRSLELQSVRVSEPSASQPRLPGIDST